MSSIYVYLSEEVKNKEGYEEKQRSERGQQWKEYRIAGMYLFRDKERPYISLSEIECPIPEIVSDIVVGFSLRDWIPSRPKRINGIYKLETATATVDTSGDRTEVRITAEKLEDLRELYYKIRAGQTFPSENWEAEQITDPSPKTEETELATKKKSKGFFSSLRSRLASIRSK